MPLFRGMKRKGAILLPGVILSSLLFAACDNSPSIIEPKGFVAGQESGLFWFILVVATIIFVIVESLLIYSIVRFRERPNTPAPEQVHGNNTLELLWTVIPSIFLFIVLFLTIRTMFALAQPNSSNKVVITAHAHQWWWEFDYQNQHITTADTLHVPANTTIQVNLFSDNVIHSFWVPQLTGKTDVVPGHDNHLWFNADQPSSTFYEGACAEFCGDQHAHMRFNVKVDSADDFNTWVSQQQAKAQTPSDSLAAKGQQLFAKGACTGCHGIVGVNLTSFDDPKAASLIGPNLTHFGSRDLIAGGVLTNTNANLATWLHDPQAVKSGNDMPNLNLSDSDIQALVAYLESLK